jgi:flavodoxin
LKKALIVYWSATGNTEKIAFAIRDGLKDAGMRARDRRGVIN